MLDITGAYFKDLIISDMIMHKEYCVRELGTKKNFALENVTKLLIFMVTSSFEIVVVF